MSSLARLVRPRALVLAVAFGLTVTLLPAGPASAAQRVTNRLFGMTDNDPVSFPSARPGSLRLWDSHVTWREIERSPGNFDFSYLDAAISSARRNGSDVLLVLGQTPRFHAQRPNAAAFYGRGASSPPKLWAWKRYVRKVALRYKGRGVDYQVWNEGNVPGFWSGTPAKLAELTRVTWKVLNNSDPRAQVVSPAMATRLSSQQRWMRTFYAQRTGGARVGRWMDVVSLNLYPMTNEGPEASMRLLSTSRSILRSFGVTKPIWNTEINYGLQVGGGGTARDITRKKEAAFVARTYVLNASNNIKRVFWYAWDLQKLANTQLTYATGSLTPAGKTYSVVKSWLRGTRAVGCSRSSKGTYTCTFRYSNGVKRVYWNPSRKATVRTVSSATRVYYQSGGDDRIRGGKLIGVKFAPVMVRSRR
jgi:polysaccharide biosynthesis protein PslG